MSDLALSNKTFKLEQDPYIYQLQDTPEPELFREMFPYTETPKIAFNYGVFRRICPRISSSPTRASATDSSQELPTRPSR